MQTADPSQALRIVQRNDGGAGIDQQTIEAIEQYGADRLIDEIHAMLVSKTYQPQPIKRVHIPVSNFADICQKTQTSGKLRSVKAGNAVSRSWCVGSCVCGGGSCNRVWTC